MTISVELTPEVQAELERRAALMESGVENFAASLIESALDIPKPARRLTRAEIDEFFRVMAQFSDEIPSLPHEAFTREAIYQDHD